MRCAISWSAPTSNPSTWSSAARPPPFRRSIVELGGMRAKSASFMSNENSTWRLSDRPKSARVSAWSCSSSVVVMPAFVRTVRSRRPSLASILRSSADAASHSKKLVP